MNRPVFPRLRSVPTTRSSRSKAVVIALLVLCAAMTMLATKAPSYSRQQHTSVGKLSARPAGYENIQHVIVMFQENRSTDNLFHGLPNADTANVGLNSKGVLVQLKPVALASQYGLGHSHGSFVAMYNGGRMNGADQIAVTCGEKAKNCPPANPQFKYVRKKDIVPYFQMAQQYVFGDRMFQTNQGPSFPAHQFIISGTSAPTTDSERFAVDNPFGDPRSFADTGCTAPPKEFVKLINRFGVIDSKQYPCFDHPTLPDLLDNAGLSWRYYTPAPDNIWTGPNAIYHLRFGSGWNNVIPEPTRILADISKGELPNVSWVIPNGPACDHPKGNHGLGPSWVASVVNAIGKSQYWSNTVILVTWDDWGGWYDHVPPPIVTLGSHQWGAGYAYGFRVPLMIISAYAKPSYVSHVTHDFGSIVRLIEAVFQLPSLGYADAYADDLSDSFDWSQKERAFRRIPAPFEANYFLNDHTPAGEPDDE